MSSVQEASWVQGDALVMDRDGMHARPAIQLTKMARSFESAVEVCASGKAIWVNAKSPSAVIKLRAGYRARLYVRALGRDAKDAVEQIVSLIKRDFHVG